MDTLVQWELSDRGGLALSTADDIAGGGVLLLVVDDYSTLAQVRDPDGNLVTLATPPSRPYPPA